MWPCSLFYPSMLVHAHVILNPGQHRACAEDLTCWMWPHPPAVKKLNGNRGWDGGTGDDAEATGLWWGLAVCGAHTEVSVCLSFPRMAAVCPSDDDPFHHLQRLVPVPVLLPAVHAHQGRAVLCYWNLPNPCR